MRCKFMQFFALALLSLFFSQTCLATNLIKVPESESYCANNDGFCFEWYLSKKPEIRFVDDGDEDGDVFMVYRKDVSGKYNELFQIYAALKDEQYPNTYFWGTLGI